MIIRNVFRSAVDNNSRMPWMGKKLFVGSLIFVWLMCACVVSLAARQNAESELAASIRAKLEAGQFDSAVSESRSAVAKYPASTAIYQLLGRDLVNKRDMEESRW